MLTPDGGDVVIRRSLMDPLPWRVRLHPERARTARGTLVHEALVDLAVHHSPILDTLRRIQRLDRLQAALAAYARAFCQTLDLALREVLGLAARFPSAWWTVVLQDLLTLLPPGGRAADVDGRR